MARRRLECAIQAGQAIEQGKQWPEKFSKLEIVKELKLDPAVGGVYSLQYSFDGKYLAVGYGNGGVKILNAQTGDPIRELRKSRYGGLQIMCLRFHPKDPNILLAGTGEGKLYAFNVESGTETEVTVEKGNEINCLDFSLDGYNFATGGRDMKIRVYDTKTMKMENIYEGYSAKKDPTEIETAGCGQRVFALRYHTEYEHIFVTGGWENQLKVWDTRSNDGVKRSISGPHVCGDAIDMREREILTGSWCANNALQIWNYTEGTLTKTVPFESTNGAYLYCAQFCDNDVVVAGGSGTNNIQAVNTTTGQNLGAVQMAKPVQALDTVHGGRLIAVGGAEDVLKLAALT
ncbi:hypothetical protein ScPMuIL_004281 [Solemya velum]